MQHKTWSAPSETRDQHNNINHLLAWLPATKTIIFSVSCCCCFSLLHNQIISSNICISGSYHPAVASWNYFIISPRGHNLTIKLPTSPLAPLTWARVCWSDIDGDPSEAWLKLSLLAPKEKRSYSTVDVEILGLPVKTFCPIRAFRSWRRVADKCLPADPEMPVFRFQSGALVTPGWLNSQLKHLLQFDIDYDHSGVYTHSFRWIYKYRYISSEQTHTPHDLIILI